MFRQFLLKPLPWFRIGLATIFLVSIALRFWGLSRFNTLVFDEVYYAKFANNYLTHTQFFNAHPPLSQYLIAISIWIGSHLPVGQDIVNNLTGSFRSTWSYRWLNALTGSFIPLVVAGIAYQLTYQRSYALVAALFAAADGLFLVESRYALNNIYLVIFGLLGQWCLLLGIKRQGKPRRIWLVISGIGFGAAAAIKWNGLWFLLGTYSTWVVARVIQWLQTLHHTPAAQHYPTDQTPLQNLAQLRLRQVLLYLTIMPVLVYSISWIPHLYLVPQPGFWEMQWQILTYHQHIGSGPEVHPYCSAWYTWAWLLRPVAYFYQTTLSLTSPVPVDQPPLPIAEAKVIYAVYALGNPALWWLSTAAILYFFWLLASQIWMWLHHSHSSNFSSNSGLSWRTTGVAVYLVLNWLANLLPWTKVTRCTFLYHYMGASVFSGLAIALIVDHYLHSYRPLLRALGVTIIFLVLFAFIFWMPIYLGLPSSPTAYKLRMWLPSWI